MQSKRQSPNLKKLLTRTELANYQIRTERFTVVIKDVNAAAISLSMITAPLKTFKLLLN